MYMMPQYVQLLIGLAVAAELLRLLPLFQDLPQLALARDHLNAETQTNIHHEAFDLFI